VHAHARVKGNYNLCISGDDDFPGLTLILANTGLIGTRLFSLAKLLDEVRTADTPGSITVIKFNKNCRGFITNIVNRNFYYCT
jgi:hypothetical protein